jgi:hypothetical protein
VAVFFLQLAAIRSECVTELLLELLGEFLVIEALVLRTAPHDTGAPVKLAPSPRPMMRPLALTARNRTAA